ncbi:hypothetical protein [Lactococcus cremoris]|uniref:Uncharacterized protein n=1 Tax=Lactococcus cremoris subsp. tructae TaxID=542833 RepID=A0A2A5SY60_LACLC|nr:hypothetical protein [Lactococcus cremoris]PCS20852.1 hypothetical protein RU92_GL000500 [Lactococcus cremoris subsp. tructae]
MEEKTFSIKSSFAEESLTDTVKFNVTCCAKTQNNRDTPTPGDSLVRTEEVA